MQEKWQLYYTSGKNVIHKYYVSSFGRIKKDNFIVKPYTSHPRYYRAHGTCEFLHRLVAKYFCKKPNKNCIYVDHVDRNTFNNHFTNLRWVTPKENSRNTESWIKNELAGKHIPLTEEQKLQNKINHREKLKQSWKQKIDSGFTNWPNTGKKFSEETKAKMRESHKGQENNWKKKYFKITYILPKLQEKYNVDVTRTYYKAEFEKLYFHIYYHIKKSDIKIEYV